MIMPERRTRPDRATAQAVQKGLALAAIDGRAAAAAAMNIARVPFRVIVRVLSEPAAQRRPDQR
jgi:hypothetical protein